MTFEESVKQQAASRIGAARGSEREFREQAWAEFERQGMPGRSSEAWKYTSLSTVKRGAWGEARPVAEVPEVAANLIQDYKADFDIAVMVNGELNKKSSVLTLESGYEFKKSEVPAGYAMEDGLVSLSAAVSHGGYSLIVAPGIVFPKPLMIIHCVSGAGVWSPTLNRVRVDKGGEFQLCEVFVGEADQYLRTDLTAVELAENAKLSWVRAQMETAGASHFTDVQVRLEKSSVLHITQLNAGAAWARGTLTASLHGEGAEARVNGLMFGSGDHHVDQRVQVRHLTGLNESSQLFKGVLKDRARGVLNGKIHIAQNAQKVNSSQMNHNLLLSPTAEADTKPELEIFADDVKANHGASIGRLNEDKLFYLLSRGIPRTQAVSILARAFVSDVLMKVPSRVQREWLNARVESVLPEFVAQMEMT